MRFLRSALADNTAAAPEARGSGVFMSGGVASAAVAAFRTPSHQTDAYTLLLPTGPASATAAAEAAHGARHLRLQHHLIVGGSSLLIEAGGAARRALDFPSETNRDVVRVAMLRAASAAGVSTVLTGDGADAMFGGYGWANPAVTGTPTFPWLRRSLAPADLFDAGLRRTLGSSDYRRDRYEKAVAAVEYLPGDDAVGRQQRRTAFLTLTHYLPSLLGRLNQLGTAVGVRVHTPYADWLLAQYLLNVPWPMRQLLGIRNGLLRHTVADLLPAALVWRPSRQIPDAYLSRAWQEAQCHDLRHIITDPAQPLYDMLDRQRVTDLLTRLNSPLAGRPGDWRSALAYVVELNAWLARHHIQLP